MTQRSTKSVRPSEDGRRVIIEAVQPQVDCGRSPIKRAVGEAVVVEADILADGHDTLSAVLCYRDGDGKTWSESPMEYLGNDRWRGSFVVTRPSAWRYTITAWVDRFKTWRLDLEKRVAARQEDVAVQLLVGAQLLSEAARQASEGDKPALLEWESTLRSASAALPEKLRLAASPEVARLMAPYPDRRLAVTLAPELHVSVEREKARFGAWYEMFPRSSSPEPGRHGAFKDCEARLGYVAGMGFDVLYLPPIHPIGQTNRKGKNNAVHAGPDDVGTPWAIGAAEGGHKAVHPKLGSLDDFRRLLARAADLGIETALDLAFQCSPDHPYVKEHPEWFARRPDGSVQYAENPPKKYQDIYPFNFECEHWRDLWEELKSIVLFWIEQGVRIFRVDNPHTKPFRFWEWLIASIRQDHPDVIFLAEAFTRPKVMYRLAKLGFSQSYTYFAWRNTKWELTQYLTELTQTDVREYFRPNLWPNTPDILSEQLQYGGRPAFMARLVLAATLGASYGIYGPAFELCESLPREPGSEEYLDSEKYEVRHWDVARPGNLPEFIARVNHIRRENPALQSNSHLSFHNVDNDQIICYSKRSDDLSSTVLVVVNLDPHYRHSGWVELPMESLEIEPRQPYQMHDLLSDARYLWQGARNYVELDPEVCPAHIFRLRRRIRTERDFDYYM